MRLGTLFEPLHPLLGLGPRSLLCALLFCLGGWLHRAEQANAASGFRDVYRQFAANFGFWGALALGAAADTRWLGALLLVGLAVLVGRAGLLERRQSFLLYAVGYSTIGLIWLESLLLDDWLVMSWLGLLTVVGAIVLLLNLRSRLKQAAG
jgi:apolipoprotein N-acyltransferase